MQRSLPDRIVLSAVLIVAFAIAMTLWRDYAAAPDLLWRDIHHDRNGHYDFGLTLALALREFNLIDFLEQVERSRVWGPFHGLVMSLVLLIGGIDYRLAIVPSLIGWVVTVMFSALIARRFFTDASQRAIAALGAASFALASPAFRLLGSDVMLEGLGAGLSAIALWAWMRAREIPQSMARWRLLAIVLTLLFFHKGNYWGLLVVSLAMTWVIQDRATWQPLLRSFWNQLNVLPVARSIMRDPLLIAFAIIVAVITAIMLRGPTSVMLFGKAVSLYPPANLTTVAYALLFVRLVLLWREHRSIVRPMLGIGGYQLLMWHVMPVAISFLIPKRLSTFLWFVGPSNNSAKAPYDLTGGIAPYWDSFSTGFSAAPWIAALIIVLVALALSRIKTFPRSTWAIFIFAGISLVAVLLHPQRQGRFLGSWIFAAWIGAGAGLGVLLGLILPVRAQLVRWSAAAATIAVLGFAMARQPVSARAYDHAIRTTSGPSNLDLMRPVLSDLRNVRGLAVATPFVKSQLYHWVSQENCKCRLAYAPFDSGAATSREQVSAAMADYLARNRAERLLVIDLQDDRLASKLLGWDRANLAGIVDALNAQQRYKRVAEYPVPSYGAVVSVWALTP